MMKVDLTGRVALVTGAARHIGKTIGDTYAANGAVVIYTDIDFGTEIEGAGGSSPPSKSRLMDVTNERQVSQVIGEVVEEFGRLDILVNNAARLCLKHRVAIDEFPRSEWDSIVDTNLTGVFQVSKAAAKVMCKQGSGRIINIASIAGLVPLRLQCAYVAAKAGVINLTKCMALELASRGILVNCIAPGSILTEATRTLFYGEDDELREKAKQILDHIPLGRPGTPEEIASAALFLAAPESSYIHGHCLTVDGGWTAGYLRDF